MDGVTAVGAAASLITLLDTSVKLAVAAKNLYQAIEQAPAEIRNLSDRLALTRAILDEILLLLPSSRNSPDELIPEHLKSVLILALEHSSDAIASVKRACKDMTGNKAFSRRIRWAIIERSAAKHAISRVHEAESSLGLAVQLLQARLGLLSCTSIDHVVAAQKLLLDRVGSVEAILRTEKQSSNPQAPKIGKDSDDLLQPYITEAIVGKDSHTTKDRELMGQSGSTPYLKEILGLKSLGVSGLVSSAWNEFQSTHFVSLKWMMPSLFGQRAFVLEFKIRHYVLSPLYLTVLYGNLAFKEYISRNSRIMTACFDGDEKTVRNLIRQRETGPNAIDPETGTSLLEASIRSGNCDLVSFLLNAGASPNFINWNFFHISALQCALTMNHLDICRLLVRHGAALDHFDKLGNGLAGYLPFARSDGRADPENAKIMAVAVGFLFSISFDTWNETSIFGDVSFHQIAAVSSPGVVALLIRHGAIPNVPDRQGRTPLHEAALKLNWPVISLLVQHGNEINAMDRHGQTALHEVLNHHNHQKFHNQPHFQRLLWRTTEELLSHGADVNIWNGLAQTPLILAAARPDKSLLAMLVDAGASINAQDRHGKTALYYAASSDCCELDAFQCLLDHDADIHVSVRDWPFPHSFLDLTVVSFMTTAVDTLHRRYRAGRATSGSFADFESVIVRKFPDFEVDVDGDAFWDAQEEREEEEEEDDDDDADDLSGYGYGTLYEWTSPAPFLSFVDGKAVDCRCASCFMWLS